MRSARTGATPIVRIRLPRLRSLDMKARRNSVRSCVHSSRQRMRSRLLRRLRRQRRHRVAPQGYLLDVLEQAKRFVFVPPEIRRETARRHQLAAIILLVDDVAAQVAQRRLEHVEDEFRPGRAAGRTAAEFGAEMLFMLRLREVAQHVLGVP